MASADLKDLRGHAPIGIGGYYGTISRNVPEFNAPAFVILPEFEPRTEWGPCRWQARDEVTRPKRGDQCFVAFDNRRQPWVIAWWPF